MREWRQPLHLNAQGQGEPRAFWSRDRLRHKAMRSLRASARLADALLENFLLLETHMESKCFVQSGRD